MNARDGENVWTKADTWRMELDCDIYAGLKRASTRGCDVDKPRSLAKGVTVE